MAPRSSGRTAWPARRHTVDDRIPAAAMSAAHGRGGSRRPMSLSRLPAYDADSGELVVVVETSKGTCTKLGWDEARGTFVLRHVLPQGAVFPFNFGFVPSTLASDNDPLDVLLLMEGSLPAGCIVPARVIGVIEATQRESEGEAEDNHRLVAVATACPLYADVATLDDLSGALLDQIEHFFISYNEMRGKMFSPTGRYGPRRAADIVDDGLRRAKRRSR